MSFVLAVSFASMTEHLSFSLTHGLGLLQLERPKALNALSMEMVFGLRDQLLAWEQDEGVREYLMVGSLDKGLCAGGDVKALYAEAIAAPKGQTSPLTRDFFYYEYQLNALLSELSKPFSVLMNGVCMGGGMGLAINADQRIVSETTKIAMPETAIGFIPDVGATYFLSHLPSEAGTYMALTGARLSPADALAVGLATHYVPQDRLSDFVSVAQADGCKAGLERLSEPKEAAGDSGLADQMPLIQRCFSADRVSEIFDRLAQEGSEGAAIAEVMQTRSPSSMALSLALQRNAEGRSFKECLQLEFNVAQWLFDPKRNQPSDFFEGIRAVLVDKDHQPKWHPSKVDDVTPDQVAQALSFPADRIAFLA